MEERFSRTALLFTEAGMERIFKARIAVFGVGGVGSYAVEALARAGIGEILLIDCDKVSESNINRQIIATYDTVGRLKTEVAKERILSINPNARVRTYNLFYSEETKDEIDLSGVDFIIDAIDTVKSKILLIEEATKLGIRIISSMGTGNKLDPTRFKIADIKKTSVCPLARVMRAELKKRGISSLKVLYSDEEPIKVFVSEEGKMRHAPGSCSFVPSVAGLIIAGEIIREIAKSADTPS